MTTQGIRIIYDIEDLRKVFEVFIRVVADTAGLGEPTEAEIQAAWENWLTTQGLVRQGEDPQVTAALQALGLSSGAPRVLNTLSDLEIENLLLPLLETARDSFVEQRVSDPQVDPQRAIQDWEQFFRQHVGTQGLGKPFSPQMAQARRTAQARRQREQERQGLVQQGFQLLADRFTLTTPQEYVRHLFGLVEQQVDVYLEQADISRALDEAPPDFAQFLAPLVLDAPTEKAFLSQQALKDPQRAAIQVGIQQGIISSKSKPEEIDAFLKELLPRATQHVAILEQEALAGGQSFDFLAALGLGLKQASQEQEQETELQRMVRNADIFQQKRAAEQKQAATPLGDITDLPKVLQDFLRTPITGGGRAEVEEQFFREFLAELPRGSLAAFTRPKPGFEQLSPSIQQLLEGVAQGQFPQLVQSGPPSTVPQNAQALQGPLPTPSQTPNQRAANQLFGMFNQQQQQTFQPFDLEGFLSAQREQFKKVRLPQIDLESFMAQSSRPPRVGRNIFLRGGL